MSLLISSNRFKKCHLVSVSITVYFRTGGLKLLSRRITYFLFYLCEELYSVTGPWESEPSRGAGGLLLLCYCHYVAFVKLLHKPKFPRCHLLNLPTSTLWAQIISQTLIGVYLDQSMQPAFSPSTWVANDSHMSGLLYWTCFLFNHDHCWQAAFSASEKPFRIPLILTKKLSLGGEIEYCLLASE